MAAVIRRPARGSYRPITPLLPVGSSRWDVPPGGLVAVSLPRTQIRVCGTPGPRHARGSVSVARRTPATRADPRVWHAGTPPRARIRVCGTPGPRHARGSVSVANEPLRDGGFARAKRRVETFHDPRSVRKPKNGPLGRRAVRRGIRADLGTDVAPWGEAPHSDRQGEGQPVASCPVEPEASARVGLTIVNY